MNIAIIGTGNVGGALATRWAQAGHTIVLGARPAKLQRKRTAGKSGTTAYDIPSAVEKSEVIIATPAPAAVEITKSLGNTAGKIIIDSMNIVMKRTGRILHHSAGHPWSHSNERGDQMFNTYGIQQHDESGISRYRHRFVYGGRRQRSCQIHCSSTGTLTPVSRNVTTSAAMINLSSWSSLHSLDQSGDVQRTRSRDWFKLLKRWKTAREK